MQLAENKHLYVNFSNTQFIIQSLNNIYLDARQILMEIQPEYRKIIIQIYSISLEILNEYKTNVADDETL